MKISQLQKHLRLGEIIRDCEFSYFDKMDNVNREGSVVFVTERRFFNQLNNPLICGVVTTTELQKEIVDHFNIGVWIYPEPKDLFYQVHEYLVSENFYYRPWENRIAGNATISPRAIVADHSVEIGPGSIIDDHVIIKPFTRIGENTIIRANSDIGSDGFEVSQVNGRLKVIKHGGMIMIGDNVEIQSLNTISRGLFPTSNTVIGNSVKIADNVHVAHAVKIGEKTLIAAGVTISGNTTIGKNVWIGPGAVLSNRITIGDHAYISIGAVVVRNVQAGERVTGNFAVDHTTFLKFITKNRLI